MNADKLRSRIVELDHIAATTPHAATRRDAQIQAKALRAKVGDRPPNPRPKPPRPPSPRPQGFHWNPQNWPRSDAWQEQMDARYEQARQASQDQILRTFAGLFEDVNFLGAFGKKSFRP